MTEILVATGRGCLTFNSAGHMTVDFDGRPLAGLASELDGSCLAVVDGTEIWRRSCNAEWSHLQTTSDQLAAIASLEGRIFAATAEPALLRESAAGELQRLTGFDTIEGRSEWFAQGPPLCVRSLTATADGGAILAAVHVGGIPRSTDGGETWAPTIPVMHDVHEVRAHPSRPEIVAAATAYGLCLSQDAGLTWTILADGLEVTHALAVAALDQEVLFSVQSGPLADCSQIWTWKVGAASIEQVLDGLPHWLDGKVDTGQISVGAGLAAIVDGGGTLWLSAQGARGWERVTNQVPYSTGIVII